MRYFIDKSIDLTFLFADFGLTLLEARSKLIQHGLSFADANAFTRFYVYGFHGPDERQTLTMRQKMRLSVLDESSMPRGRKEPPAWNRM
jgi:hypothetical protein